MAQPLRRGARLFSLSECGAVFPYPDALTPFEWLCLMGVRRGWNKYENERVNEKPKQ